MQSKRHCRGKLTKRKRERKTKGKGEGAAGQRGGKDESRGTIRTLGLQKEDHYAQLEHCIYCGKFCINKHDLW